jgi:hypothetical protein
MIKYQASFFDGDWVNIDPDAFDPDWEADSRKKAFFLWSREEGALAARIVMNGVVMDTIDFGPITDY